MKKIFVFATMVASTLLVSCSEGAGIDTTAVDNPDTPQVQITFGTDARTRAFFDEVAEAEPWESEILSLSVYVFDSSGKFVVKRTLTASEIANLSARIPLPNSTAGTTCSFYVVANADYGNVPTESAMIGLTESATLGEYNGTFAQTAQGRKRGAGFVMTAWAKTTIAAAGSPTTVSVRVRRTVAKIAVRTTVDPSLSAMFNGGSVTINSVRISKAAATTLSFFHAEYLPERSTYQTTQTPHTSGSNTNALFYIYESLPVPAGERVLLTLTGYFDADNNASTTNDRSGVEYTIELAGAGGGGGIHRNGYYRVETVIKGLSGDTVGINISAAEWEAPATQTVELGN